MPPRPPTLGTPPRKVSSAAEGVPTSFGDAIGIVRRFLELPDVPPKQLLLRARQELELPEQEGTMRQQLQRILKEIGREDVVFTRSPAVDPPSPPATLSARPPTVLRQAVVTAELQAHAGDAATADVNVAINAAINEKKKLESLVQQMIVKHQKVLVERTVAQDARARAEEELARLRNELETTKSLEARSTQLERMLREKELELAQTQDKIKEFVSATKRELDNRQAQLVTKKCASDLLQLRLATQRATCVSALRARVTRALRSRCFFTWARNTLSASVITSPSSHKRSGTDISEARDSEALCDKFRSLVSGTFVGRRADALFKHHDRDQDGRWSWADFCRAVRSSAHVTDFAMSDDELRTVFDSRDQKGVGLITIEQLQQLVSRSLGHSPNVSSHPRMKPPGKTHSVAMTQLRRAATDANRRVRELEATAEQHAVLTVAIRTWATIAAATRRVRVIFSLLSELRRANLFQTAFTEWARILQWRRRGARIVAARESVRFRCMASDAFTRWVTWRERLAMKRLAGALKAAQEVHNDSDMRYHGNAVKARKQLQARVEVAEQETVESRQRADDLAEALKLMTVKLQKSEAAVLELSDLVAFSQYGGRGMEPQVHSGASPHKQDAKLPSPPQTYQSTTSMQIKCPAARASRTGCMPLRASSGRKPPASSFLNTIVTLHTESNGQKLGFILDKGSSAPCSFAKVTSGGLADKAKIRPGYKLIAVQGQSLEDCNYAEAVSAIREAASGQSRTLELTVRAPDECCKGISRCGTPSCGAHRTKTQRQGLKSDILSQRNGYRQAKSALCPEPTVKPVHDYTKFVGPSTPPSRVWQPSVDDNELSLSPVTPVSAVECTGSPQYTEPEDGPKRTGCITDCRKTTRKPSRNADGNSRTLQMAEQEEEEEHPSRIQPAGAATCWAEVVDPFASLKERGPETCATSAKEALHFDSVRKSRTSSAEPLNDVGSDTVNTLEVQE